MATILTEMSHVDYCLQEAISLSNSTLIEIGL